MNSDFARLVEAGADSVLWRSAEATAIAFRRAWGHSATAAAFEAARTSWASRDKATRLRDGALVAAWAAVFYFALLMVTPRYVASGLPPIGVAVVAVVAALVALRATDVEQAWRHSRMKKLVDSWRAA